MIDHSRWRDQQIASFRNTSSTTILAQEYVMLDFISQLPGVKWQWHGNQTTFKSLCKNIVCIVDNNSTGAIIFGRILQEANTTSRLVNKIQHMIKHVDYAYVAINRYELLKHDLDFELPDSIEETLDRVMQQCDPNFKRLHTFAQVDGNHMIAAHPMDCYGLCK